MCVLYMPTEVRVPVTGGKPLIHPEITVREWEFKAREA